MSTFRLDSVSPTLGNLFRQASPTKRKCAARIATEAAVAIADLSEQVVVDALTLLRTGAQASASLCQQLESLSERFDDEYFQLVDNGVEQSAVLCIFHKARATSALLLAFSNDTTQLHEAIYEAMIVIENRGELISSIAAALE